MNVFAAALSEPLPPPAPPADFNIKVSQLRPTRAAALTRAVHEGQLDGYYCLGQLWVRPADADDLLPAGHCSYDDADDCCFIAPAYPPGLAAARRGQLPEAYAFRHCGRIKPL